MHATLDKIWARWNSEDVLSLPDHLGFTLLD